MRTHVRTWGVRIDTHAVRIDNGVPTVRTHAYARCAHCAFSTHSVCTICTCIRMRTHVHTHAYALRLYWLK